MKFMIKPYWILLLIGCFFQCGQATNDKATSPSLMKTSVLVKGLNYPWEILWGPDNFIWMTERGGRISRVNPQTGTVIPLLTVAETVSNNEGGMLGMALHPDFRKVPQVFVAYEYNKEGQYSEKVVRYTYNGTTLINPVTLIDHIRGAFIHNGCRLLITPDLKLFITTGDASEQQLPQDISTLNGKILRLNLDGSIPTDNPVKGNPYWTFGHRNPQGLVFANHILYSSEHGPGSDDEINIIEKGNNYGWPAVMGYCDDAAEKDFCRTHQVKEPIKTWTPTAAVCGLDYYSSDLIRGWKNSLLLVSLKNARLYQLKLDQTFRHITETNEYFMNDYGRLRDLCISPGGVVYICTSNGNDEIIEVKGDR